MLQTFRFHFDWILWISWISFFSDASFSVERSQLITAPGSPCIVRKSPPGVGSMKFRTRELCEFQIRSEWEKNIATNKSIRPLKSIFFTLLFPSKNMKKKHTQTLVPFRLTLSCSIVEFANILCACKKYYLKLRCRSPIRYSAFIHSLHLLA